MSSGATRANDVTCLASVSEHVHYGTVLAVDNLQIETLKPGLTNVVHCYSVRRFNAVIMLVDMYFKTLKYRNRVGVLINLVSRGECVPKIERFHRVLKESARCYNVMIQFYYLPRMMVVHLMITFTFYEHYFLFLKGMLQVLPPLIVIEGDALDHNFHFCVMFG